MKYRIIFSLVTLGLLMTACGDKSTPVNTSASIADASTAVPASNTTTPTMLLPDDLQLTTNCTVVSRRPTPGPTEESLFAPVTEKDWAIGSQEAEVTIIEYSDFQ